VARGELSKLIPVVMKIGAQRLMAETVRIDRALPGMLRVTSSRVSAEKKRLARLDSSLKDEPFKMLRRIDSQVRGQKERLGARARQRLSFEGKTIARMKNRLIGTSWRRLGAESQTFSSLAPAVIRAATSAIKGERGRVDTGAKLLRIHAQAIINRDEHHLQSCHHRVVKISSAVVALETRRVSRIHPRLIKQARQYLKVPNRDLHNLARKLEGLSDIRIKQEAKQLARLGAGIDFIVTKQMDAERAEVERHRNSIGEKARRLVGGAEFRIEQTTEKIGKSSEYALADSIRNLEEKGRVIEMTASLLGATEQNSLEVLSQRIVRAAKARIKEQKARNKNNGRRLISLDPYQVIARGYTMLYLPSGRLVKDTTDIPRGAAVNAKLSEGEMRLRSEGPTRSESGS